MKKNFFAVFFWVFLSTFVQNTVAEEENPLMSGNPLMTMYLVFAIPEACAQTYPDLRKSVDSFREKFAKQISDGQSKPSDSVLPVEAQKEIAACNRKSGMSKAECSQFMRAISFTDEAEPAKEGNVDMESLMKKGRQMIKGCVDKMEKESRKGSR